MEILTVNMLLLLHFGLLSTRFLHIQMILSTCPLSSDVTF